MVSIMHNTEKLPFLGHFHPSLGSFLGVYSPFSIDTYRYLWICALNFVRLTILTHILEVLRGFSHKNCTKPLKIHLFHFFYILGSFLGPHIPLKKVKIFFPLICALNWIKFNIFNYCWGQYMVSVVHNTLKS